MGNENTTERNEDENKRVALRESRFRRGESHERFRRKETPFETMRRFDIPYTEFIKKKRERRPAVEVEEDDEWEYFDDDDDDKVEDANQHPSRRRRGEQKRKQRRRRRRRRRYRGDDEYSDDENNEEVRKEDVLEDIEDVEELPHRAYGDDEAEKDTRIEGDPLFAEYTSDFGHSTEKLIGAWSFIKSFAFFLFMYGAFFIVTFEYDKRECKTGTLNSGSTFCLDYETGEFQCVGLENADCFTLCAGTITLAQAEGCRICDSTATICNETETLSVGGISTTGICMNALTFKTRCLDQRTCLDTTESDIKSAIVLIGMMCLILCCIEFVRAMGLFHFSTYIHTDFYGYINRLHSIMLILAKNGGLLSQVIWCFVLLAVIYLLLVTFAFGSLCREAVTSTGGTFEFPNDTLYYTIATGSLFVIVGIIGTYFRFNIFVRGELARVSWDNRVRVPLGLDCADIRENNRPRCFTKDSQLQCKKSCCYCVGFRWIPTAWAWTLECMCMGPLAIGSIIGWMYAHRHYIGP